MNPAGRRVVALAYGPLAVGSAAAVVARLAGQRIHPALVAGGAVVLLGCMLVAAACAMHALLRRRWGWGAALLALWPLAVPAYLWVGSAEPEV